MNKLHPSPKCYTTCICNMHNNTYSYKYAVEVSWFVSVAVRGERLPEDLCQTLHAGDAHDVDVDVAAEGLDEREVDLKRNIILVFLICR